jgi:hypothetical protein
MFLASCIAFIACNASDPEPSQPPPVDRDAGPQVTDAAVTDAAVTDAAAGATAGAAAKDAEISLDAGISDAGDASIEEFHCDATAPLSCPNPMPHYADVEQIFAERCVSCHNGAGEEWPLTSYEHVADWSGEIRAQMLACSMPPVYANIAMPLEERQTILNWIRCGFPK